MKKLAILICILLSSSFFTKTSLAKDLSLYISPNTKSKVAANIKSGTQLIPIYHPKKSAWIKVADPKNGKVGWVKISELKNPLLFSRIENGGFSIQQHIISRINKKTGKPESYSIIEYNGPVQLKPEQIAKLKDQMQNSDLQIQKDIQAMQASMQKMMQNMFKDINFAKDFQTFPIIQSIVVVPE